jgi:hypothetical protein
MSYQSKKYLQLLHPVQIPEEVNSCKNENNIKDDT